MQALQILVQLGEIQQDEQWQDYVGLGIEPGLADELLALMGDSTLHQADVDSNEVWVPQHAWRALAQVGDDQQVAGLLALLDGSLLIDVWAAQELPLVIGKLSASSIPLLAVYLSEASHTEGARIIVAEGLKCLVEQQSELRQDVVNVLTQYLSAADDNAPELNGIVVCCLVDLKAAESIEAIRTIYTAGTIDVSYAGQIEDIEIDLGLRPMPEGKLQSASTATKAADDTFAGQSLDDEIEKVLIDYRNNNSITNISELDGFFSALGCAPESVGVEHWLGSIWGGSNSAPQWASKEEGDAFISAVMVTYKRVLQALNTDTYSALFSTQIVDGELVVDAADWCKGFLRGLNLWGHLNPTDAIFLKEAMQPIRLFATESGRQRLKVMNKGGIAYQHKKIEKSVRNMYQHWMAQRQKAGLPMLNPTRNVGRNDLCPCGSGKKFKKCCLH